MYFIICIFCFQGCIDHILTLSHLLPSCKWSILQNKLSIIGRSLTGETGLHAGQHAAKVSSMVGMGRYVSMHLYLLGGLICDSLRES